LTPPRDAGSDALFFSGRLVVKADTEVARLVMNTLDITEIARTRDTLPTAMGILSRCGL
jgi:predicted lipid carrier protein YhbT